VKCRFSILSRGALQGASFTRVKMLIEAIETFIASWNQHATPFEGSPPAANQTLLL